MPPNFNQRVYALVRRIPAGRVATYGQIGALLGSTRWARQVGWAMAACMHADAPVPWHRVINASGGISHRGDLEGARHQREQLEQEGVRFGPAGTVDLATYRWSFADVDATLVDPAVEA